MARYELSLSPNYVKDWTVVEAVRELFQNALDQQTVQPENEMYFGYEELNYAGILRIGNKSSILDVKTLLLGESTKSEDTRTIGKFGEGYKLACLVLTRLGYEVLIHNYGARELWKPKFTKSKKYNGEKILVFDVEKQHFWKKVPDNNLTIEIYGITKEVYQRIVESNLNLQKLTPETDYFGTTKGKILLKSKFKGRLYVGGLFICKDEKLVYGYDFRPGSVELDRDRKLIRDWDLKWSTADMWLDVEGQDALIKQLFEADAVDVQYMQNMEWISRATRKAEKLYEAFIEDHGEDAMPVYTQEEINELSVTDTRAVVVPKAYAAVLSMSSTYKAKRIATTPTKKTPEQILKELLDEVEAKPYADHRFMIREIYEQSKNWRLA